MLSVFFFFFFFLLLLSIAPSLFKRPQDDIFDGFQKSGKFPGPSHHIPRRLNDLLMFLFWAVLLWVPLFYYIVTVFVSGSLTQQLVVVAVTATGEYVEV